MIPRHLLRSASVAGTIVAVSAIAVTLGACSKSDGAEKKSDDAPTAKASGVETGFTEVPNIEGMQAKVPATFVPNGIGGAAGFNVKGSKLSVIIRELTSAEAKPMDDEKKDTEQVLFKKWISSEKTADGFVLQWEGASFDGDGTTYNFEVRKTVGTKTVTCYGGGASAAEIATGIGVCKSLKAL